MKNLRSFARALALAAAASIIASGSPAQATTAVRVLVPDSDNLQYLAFWTARGAGYFDDEGVAVELVIPDVPAQAIARMIAGEAPVAVLPPPVYLQLVADRFPLRLVANLLRNDPIDLVVRRSVFEARHLDASAPLRDRLASLQGLRVGVAPGPPARLRALFTSVGLDADRDIQMVIRHGQEQNAAFARDECDALYAHTPYLEQAIDDQDAVVLVNQSGGEVPTLAMRQIHALVVRDDFLGAQRPVVAALVRAVARAEALVHTDLHATEEAVARALPSIDRRHLRTLLGLYQAAIPPVPNVSAEGLAPALALFPANRTAPSLAGVTLADFVTSDVTGAGSDAAVAPKPAPTPSPSWMASAAALLAVAALAGATLARRRRRAR